METEAGLTPKHLALSTGLLLRLLGNLGHTGGGSAGVSIDGALTLVEQLLKTGRATESSEPGDKGHLSPKQASMSAPRRWTAERASEDKEPGPWLLPWTCVLSSG